MQSDEALAAETAVEARLAEAGADQIRSGPSFAEAPEAAPETGTPAETTERVRDEQGRFITNEPVTETGTVEEQVAPEQDPAVASFLAKYNGDVDKALEGAVNLQKQAGRASNEVGELRQLVDQLSQLNGNLEVQNQPRPAPLDQATVDWFDEQIIQNPVQALDWAARQGNQMLVARGLETWKQTDPYEAAVFTTQAMNQAAYQQFNAQLQRAQALPLDATVNMALTNVRARNPQFSSYDEVLGDALTQYPAVQEQLQAAAAAGDSQKLEAVIETAYALARGDTLTQAILAGATPETSTTTTDVVQPVTSETREPAPEPTATDRFHEEFRQEAERQNRGVWVAN